MRYAPNTALVASWTTRMKELPRGISGEEHLLKRVARLTPSPSKLYANDQLSASWSRGGMRSLISSATALESMVDVVAPDRVRGVKGGG